MQKNKKGSTAGVDLERMGTILIDLRDHFQKSNAAVQTNTKDAELTIATTTTTTTTTTAAAAATKAQEEDLNSLIKELGKDFHVQDVMNFLARRLFIVETQQQDAQLVAWNSADALSVMVGLVSCDPSRYLKEASRAVKAEANQLHLLSSSSSMTTTTAASISSDVLMVMVAQISGNDVEVSTNSTEAVVALCQHYDQSISQQAIQFITQSLKQGWETVQNGGKSGSEATTVCVRCITAIMDIISHLGGSNGGSDNRSDNDNVHDHRENIAMETAISCGATDILLRMMTEGSDPLLQMSILDVLEQFSTRYPIHTRRAKWLFSDPVVYPLLDMAGGGGGGGGHNHEESNNGATADPILGGPALRVLSSLCKVGQQCPEHLQLTTQTLQGFHRALHHFDYSTELDRLAIIDAISSFASASQEALQLVLDDPVTREAWLSLHVAQPKLKSAILASIAMVMDPTILQLQHRSGHENNQTTTNNTTTNNTKLLLQLYTGIGQTNNHTDTTQLIMSFTKSSLPETRLGAYSVLQSVVKLSIHGAQLLLSNPEFYQFVTSTRNDPNFVETTKIGREVKFSILEAILQSPVKGLLAEDIVHQLEGIYRQGPHYIEPLRHDVSTE